MIDFIIDNLGVLMFASLVLLFFTGYPVPIVLGGTALTAARDAMMSTGNVINVSTRPPTSGAERGSAIQFMNTASPSRPNSANYRSAAAIVPRESGPTTFPRAGSRTTAST